ncbi:PepSY-associated TM helix domain-containing protein [Pseudonocardia spinosispora]|uniref:PepSY-associated TM helix domain-containing protein n=1 Tax=Pseudonocardia spinosispora TaxID=103441 RepID=UPI0004145AC9|nr:PepSY domain-containing protein [Pseudonocardia spinosispora]
MSETLEPAPIEAPARPEPPTVSSARGHRARRLWSNLRPLVVRLHFYVGLFVGPFILVAAVTGLLYTITPQLDRFLYDDALHTSVGATRLDLRDQVAAAAKAVPGATVTEIRPPISPDGTTRVTFDAPGVAPDFARTAFVDPYTGQVKAVLDTFGEWLPARAWIDALHRTLHLGDVGRGYSELAASWLWVLAVSGLALWIVRRRARNRIRGLLLPEGSARGRVRIRSWHGAVGVWIAIGMLGLSVTGLTWSNFAGTNVGALRAALHWTTPSAATRLPPTAAAVPANLEPASVGAVADTVLAGARAAGLIDPVAITPATATGRAWHVAQVKRSWPLRQDAVAVDPATGAVVDTVRWRDWPFMAKAAEVGISAHMGILFGVANQVLLVVLALGIIGVVLWGYRMWWLRRPTAGGRGAPGGTQRPGMASIAIVGAAAIALGVFFPVLGASLVLFLVGDLVWDRLRVAGSHR